jgi:Ricin-type beta-trefoil lectin domain/PAN domain
MRETKIRKYCLLLDQIRAGHMRDAGRNRRKTLAFAVAAAAVTFLFASPVQSATVKDVFEKYDLLGTLAADCGKPADAKSSYVVHRVIDPDHVQLDRMVGRDAPDFTAIIDRAAESKANEIALSYIANNRRYSATYRVEHGRIRADQATGEDGEKQIAQGRYTNNNAETPWFAKCSLKITIQSAPEGGGKCIDVPNSNFTPGKHLQMWDCNDTEAQIFAFDALNGRLVIGGLCVEAGGGRGQPNDPIQLAKCSSAPNQVWKTEPIGDSYKFVGINSLCFDIANHSKENGGILQIWRCHGESNQRFVLRQGLDLTYEEKAYREGNYLRDFNLAQPDPKICQRSCIEDRQCVAWNYRKPEGRPDHKPHCWLVTKITERKQGDPLTISGSVRVEAPK